MPMSDNVATKRRKLMEEINGVLATADTAHERIASIEEKYQKALSAMKSEKGTAQKELDKSAEQYEKLKVRLDALMPNLEVHTDLSADSPGTMTKVAFPLSDTPSA